MSINKWLHISVPIIMALVVNGVIYLNKWGISKNTNPLIPPGWIVGTIWVILFGLLGYAHYLTWVSATSIGIIVMLAYSLLYPFITRLKLRLIYDVIALVLAAILCILAAYEKREALVYVIPLFIWASYVVIVGGVQRSI